MTGINKLNTLSVQNSCAAAGLGIVVMQDKLAAAVPDMKKIEPGFELPALPLHIVAQQELRASRKLRVVYDGLAQALVEFYQ